MAELSDLAPEVPAGLSVRRARVISIAGRSLTVDLGGPIVVQALDSCNPIPNQFVYLIGEGTSFTAIAAVGGVHKQSTITVTVDGASGVAGLVNGVLVTVAKVGAFTATVGDVLPLFWSADGSGVWAGQKGSSAYVPPPPAPPAGGGGSSTPPAITTGTASYPATWSGWYSPSNGWHAGQVLGSGPGGFFYGASRFRELQGRTITGFRGNFTRASGSTSVVVYGNGQAGPSGNPPLSYNAGAIAASGWNALPIGLAAFLIAGSGTGAIIFNNGATTLNGIPSGTLQFDWRR